MGKVVADRGSAINQISFYWANLGLR